MNLSDTIKAYGTSEGVSKAWDSRGRGRHTIAAEPRRKLEKEWDKNWSKKPGHEHYHPFNSIDGTKYFGARNAKGKLVAGANVFHDKDAFPGKTVGYINMINSHEPGAGAELIDHLQQNYKYLTAQATTSAGASAIRKMGFTKVAEADKNDLGTPYAWAHPSASSADRKNFFLYQKNGPPLT